MTAEQNPVDPITQQQKHQDHPFYLKTGNLEFRGIEKNTTVATGITSLLTRLPGFNNAIKANAPTLDQHKQELVTYLNISQPPFRDNSLN
ncbi:MAG: hypothetical protein LBG52_08280 [Candidatus Peribacteria bacterium]|jgi:hypothetical protein|nr:hypothetical protein [Candidatus Peribacteria bacterium]